MIRDTQTETDGFWSLLLARACLQLEWRGFNLRKTINIIKKSLNSTTESLIPGSAEDDDEEKKQSSWRHTLNCILSYYIDNVVTADTIETHRYQKADIGWHYSHVWEDLIKTTIWLIPHVIRLHVNTLTAVSLMWLTQTWHHCLSEQRVKKKKKSTPLVLNCFMNTDVLMPW